MTPTEMRQLLAVRDIRLTRSLGQNFLHDTNQLRRIVAAADLKKADRVLEIGPGLGPLTELLAEQVGEVLAIEKDARLVEVLKERFHTADRRDAGPATCSMTTPSTTCSAKRAIGASGSWSPTCLTPSPRRFWWSWPRGAARSAWSPRCKSRWPSG